MPRGRGTHKTAFKDITGQIFNYWTVISRAADMNGRTYWNCRCVCGTEKAVSAIHLRLNNSKSCGCVRPRKEDSSRFKHGMTDSITWRSWQAMMHRCYSPSHRNVRNYFQKGIVVCERWHEFLNFLEDMGERPSQEHSIGRLDHNANYGPDNCRWQTPIEQSNATSRNKFITFNGRTMTLAEWCRELNVNYSRVKWRLRHGWTECDALARKALR